MASTIDLTANFDTVLNWSYNYENHRNGFIEENVNKLCNMVSEKLTALSLSPATDEDKLNIKTALLWLMSHKPYFTINDFLGILKPCAKTEFMSSIYKPVVAAEVSSAVSKQVADLQEKLKTFEYQANQIDVLEGQIKKIQHQNILRSQHQHNPVNRNAYFF